MVDLSKKTDGEIDSWIRNHEAKGATNTPLYRELLEDRARRQSSGLKIEVSLAQLMRAARNHEFTTYGALAKANGVPWNIARHAMNGAGGHLDRLLDVCHARGLPLLTALCVNQQGVTTGGSADAAMKGFIGGAHRLGYSVTDGEEFLRECQTKCFAWADQHSNGSFETKGA